MSVLPKLTRNFFRLPNVLYGMLMFHMISRHEAWRNIQPDQVLPWNDAMIYTAIFDEKRPKLPEIMDERLLTLVRPLLKPGYWIEPVNMNQVAIITHTFRILFHPMLANVAGHANQQRRHRAWAEKVVRGRRNHGPVCRVFQPWCFRVQVFTRVDDWKWVVCEFSLKSILFY